MIRLKSLITSLLIYTKTHRKQTIVGSVLFIAAFMYTAAFLLPTRTVFSYGGSNCIQKVIPLPAIHSTVDDSAFSVQFRDEIKIGGLPVAATTMCLQPTSWPAQGTHIVATAPYGWLLARTHVSVSVSGPPRADVRDISTSFPVSKPLAIDLTEQDKVFTYSISANEKSTVCEQKNKTIECDIPSLQLRQDTEYYVRLLRQFENEKPSELASSSVRTLKATTIKSTSIPKAGVIYNNPTAFTFTADKELAVADATLVQKDKPSEKLPITVTVTEKMVTIALEDELAREQDYVLTLTRVEAEDGSTITEPYKTSFSMSGGPKVTAVSVGANRVDPSAVITLDFDQALSEKQPVAKTIRVNGGTATVSRVSDTRVAVSLVNVPRCTPFSIEVLKGTKSEFDIATTESWKHASRTLCHTVSRIGTSIQGRPIHAYMFGNGGPATLYVGAIHGNEVSSQYILEDWINELEANYSRIPSSGRVVIVPSVNPDGVAAGTRNNARNVNLSRNFPTDNWVEDIDDTNGTVKGGGGSKPLSEPEAKVIADFSASLQPRLLVSYHAIGSLVVGDPGGYSAAYAKRYAGMVGYRDATGQSADMFDYSITGSYEDWTYQKAGIPSMIVELGSYSYRNFSHHKEAFWAMLK